MERHLLKHGKSGFRRGSLHRLPGESGPLTNGRMRRSRLAQRCNIGQMRNALVRMVSRLEMEQVTGFRCCCCCFGLHCCATNDR